MYTFTYTDMHTHTRTYTYTENIVSHCTYMLSRNHTSHSSLIHATLDCDFRVRISA